MSHKALNMKTDRCMNLFRPPGYVTAISTMSSSAQSSLSATVLSSSWTHTSLCVLTLTYEPMVTYTRHNTEEKHTHKHPALHQSATNSHKNTIKQDSHIVLFINNLLWFSSSSVGSQNTESVEIWRSLPSFLSLWAPLTGCQFSFRLSWWKRALFWKIVNTWHSEYYCLWKIHTLTHTHLKTMVKAWRCIT